MLADMSERGKHNLGQIQRVIADGVEDEILKLIDGCEQILPERSHFGEACSKPQAFQFVVNSYQVRICGAGRRPGNVAERGLGELSESVDSAQSSLVNARDLVLL